MIKEMRMRWVRHAEFMGNMKNTYTALIRNPERKMQL
jgi:hypothetical protein